MHARAIYQEIDRVLRQHGVKNVHVEGEASGTWILIDMGDVVVHVFRGAERRYYDLERIWSKAAAVPLPEL
mgnify:FL=1